MGHPQNLQAGQCKEHGILFTYIYISLQKYSDPLMATASTVDTPQEDQTTLRCQKKGVSVSW